MRELITHIGLDVHKDSIAIASATFAERGRFIGTVGPELKELLKVVQRVGSAQTLKLVYEAGPCGYGLVRQLRSKLASPRKLALKDEPAAHHASW